MADGWSRQLHCCLVEFDRNCISCYYVALWCFCKNFCYVVTIAKIYPNIAYIPPNLPPTIPITDVYTDFLQYILWVLTFSDRITCMVMLKG